MKVTPQELLKMYKDLKESFNAQAKEIEELLSVIDDCRKTLHAQEELIDVLKQELREAEFRLENKQNYEQFCEKQKNTCGVEKIGDLNDYEYMSDGKRMCFQNYQTGNRVYAGDTLFSVLKNRMLRGEEET